MVEGVPHGVAGQHVHRQTVAQQAHQAQAGLQTVRDIRDQANQAQSGLQTVRAIRGQACRPTVETHTLRIHITVNNNMSLTYSMVLVLV